jgi:hypothetical protein
MISEIKYYRDERGNFPARDFINDPHHGGIKSNIMAAIAALQINGLDLIDTERMSFIGYRDDGGPRIQGLYELRNEKKKWRVAVFHDKTIDKFILLCGWRKNQQRQPADILRAQRMQEEYLTRKERGDVVTD